MAVVRGDVKNKMKNFSGISSTLYAAKQLFQTIPSQPLKDAHAIQNFLSPFERILRSALKKLLAVVSIRKYRGLHDEIIDKINLLSNLMKEVVETQDLDGNANKYRIQSHLLLLQNNHNFFVPFRDACLTRSVKILLVALDGLQVLLSCGFFSSCSDYLYAIDLKYKGKKSGIESTNKCQWGVMEDVLELIISLSEIMDDSVQLKVLRCFLTMLTATCCTRLQGDTLLRAIQGVFTLYSSIKSDQNQRTAEAALTQIINTLMYNTKGSKVNSAENYSSNTPFMSYDFSDSDLKYPVSERMMMNPCWIVSNTNTEERDERIKLQRRKTFCCVFMDSSKKENIKRFHSEPYRQRNFHTLATCMLNNSLDKKLCSAETLSVYETGECDFLKTNSDVAQTSIQDQQLILSYLCSLTTKEESGDIGDDYFFSKIKKLALELLLSLMQNEYETYKNTPAIINFIQHELFPSIVRNSLSPITKIFEISLSLFTTLFTHFRDQLNFEIMIFVQYILLYFLESEFCPFEHKEKVLQVLHTLMKDFRFVVEVYINFDCNVKKPFLFLRVVEQLCNLAHITASTDSYATSLTQAQQSILRQLSLEILIIFLESVFDWVTRCFKQNQIDCHFFQTVETLQNMEKEYKNSNESPSTCEKYNYTATEFEGLVETQPPCVRHYNEFAETPSLQSCSMCKNDRFIIIRRNCERKNRLIKLIEVFNRDPGKGIDLLIENNFVKKNPLHVALFFLHITGLSKESIGNYLGCDKPFNVDTLHAFVNQLQFRNMEIDTALRKFLSLFRLPGEAQKIDRMMESFAAKYVQDNPKKFENADCAYVLAFSLVMLHTDAHARSIRPENKMTVDMFIKNNRGINNNSDLPAEYLAFLYHRVVEEEWTLENSTASDSKFTGIKIKSLQSIPGVSVFSPQDSQQLFLSGVATALGFSNGKKKSGIFRKQAKFLTDIVLGYLSNVSQEHLHSDTYFTKTSKKSQTEITNDTSLSSFGDTDEPVLQLFIDTVDDFIQVDDDLVCLVQYLFQSISSFLHKTFSRTWQETQENKSLCMKSFSLVIVRDSRKTDYILHQCLHLCKISILLGNAFYLVTESTPFFSELVFSTGLSAISGLSFFFESLLSQEQIQSLVNLFDIITTHKCYNVAQNEWHLILKICSLLNALINTDASSLVHKTLKEERNTSTTTTQKKSQNSSLTNILVSGDNSNSQQATDYVSSSIITKKKDVVNTTALSYASESLKTVFGLGKTPRDENKKKITDSIEPNSEEIVLPEMHTFQTNYEQLSDLLSDAQIDCLFVHSVNFSSTCIEKFINGLCEVSMEELKLTKPRMFSLQKIVEVADYNVNRIGAVQKKFWTTVVNFFNNITVEVSFCEKIEIGLYTIDSLRQLFLKFLDQNISKFDEFQEEFLKPYLLLMQCSNVTKDMKHFIVEVLTRIIQTRSRQLKSGWRTILHTLEAIPTAEGNNTALCNEGFHLLLTLLKTNFANILSNNMKEVLNTFSVYYLNCYHMPNLNTTQGVTVSYKVLEYLEWLAIIFSGETYNNYCNYVRVTPDEDVRNFELDVFDTISKRIEEINETMNSSKASYFGEQHATTKGQVESLNVSTDIKDYNIQLFITKLFELHCLRLAQTPSNFASKPNHPCFAITKFTVATENLDELLVKNQQHHNPYLFSTLSCISRLATISLPEYLEVYENALETLFRLLNYFAHVFQYEDMWKMCIRGILFPYVDDLLLCLQHYKISSANQLKDNALVGVDSELSSSKVSSNLLLELEYDINNSLERSLPYKLYTLCLEHVFDLFKRQFQFITKCLSDVFSLLNTCVRGSHPQNVSKFALIIFGKMVDEIGSFCTDQEWNSIAIAFENFFSNVATQELHKPSNYSVLFDSLSSSLPSDTKFGNSTHVVSSINNEEKTNLKSLNSSDSNNASSSIIQFVPEEIIRNCITRINLIDLLSTLVRSHISSMNYSCIERFVLLLISTFESARDFNSHIEWRYHLKVKRIFRNSSQLPGLLKQECEALKNSFVILFTFLKDSNVDNSQIKLAFTQFLSLLENVVIDVAKKCQSFQAPTMDLCFESTISSMDYHKIYCSEIEQEIALITNILLTVVFDSLRHLPTHILEVNAKRLFICLLYLIPYASRVLRNNVVIILLDCILPCLKCDSHCSIDTEFIPLVSNLKSLCGETKLSQLDVSMIPPPPPPSPL